MIAIRGSQLLCSRSRTKCFWIDGALDYCYQSIDCSQSQDTKGLAVDHECMQHSIDQDKLNTIALAVDYWVDT